MALMQIRLSEKTVNESRKIGNELFGESTTDDKTIWTLVMEYKKSQVEKELYVKNLKEAMDEIEKLKNELEECRKTEKD